MRIVHLGPSVLPIPHPRGGAIQRRMLELGGAQAACGHEVLLLSAGEHRQSVRYADLEIRTLACRCRNRYLRDLEFMRGAARALAHEPVDVMHFHSLPEGAAFSSAITCVKVLSYDYFVFRKGRKNPLYWWYRRALQQFSSLLPVSEFCCGLSHRYWNLQSTRSRVLYNGVNPRQFFPDHALAASRKKLLRLSREPVLLYVGRVCEQKGTDLLLDAYLQLKRQGVAAHLVVAGPCQQFGNAATSPLARRISASGGLYLGAVEERDLAAIYNLADIFVMPTRSLEMFGMAALEAQACGKPVVASRHGGLPEVIAEDSGRFFAVGDATALALELRRLLENHDLMRSLANAARANALRFTWSRLAEELNVIYGAALPSTMEVPG